MLILAIDQGTTNTKGLLIDAAGKVLAQATATRLPLPPGKHPMPHGPYDLSSRAGVSPAAEPILTMVTNGGGNAMAGLAFAA